MNDPTNTSTMVEVMAKVEAKTEWFALRRKTCEGMQKAVAPAEPKKPKAKRIKTKSAEVPAPSTAASP